MSKMAIVTPQMLKWMGSFGKEYTERNAITLNDTEELYKKNLGVTRSELNGRFLKDIESWALILEVGSNIGNQLLCLQNMGFSNLYGIDIQNYAVELSKKNSCGINIIQGSAIDIPFKDAYFDLVFTSGLLIHIDPSDVNKVLTEIHRCSRRYIWGLEYYEEKYTGVPYRGEKNLLWKGNYKQLYLDLFSDLQLVKEERLHYLNSSNVDSMFLLEKS